MNDFYLTIRNDNTVVDPFVANEYDPVDFDDWSLVSGKEIHNWDGSLKMWAESKKWDGEHDDVLQNALGIPVYSPRLQQSLIKEGFDAIQYLPISIKHSDGSEIPGYAVANILHLIPCLDFANSRCRLHTRQDRLGECRSIEKI